MDFTSRKFTARFHAAFFKEFRTRVTLLRLVNLSWNSNHKPMTRDLKAKHSYEDPPHRIIDSPSTYQIVGFRYWRDPARLRPQYIELDLYRAGVIRCLRFWEPQDISAAAGFPESPGLYIADVSTRQMEGLGVRVGDYEGSGGGVWFWAKSVEEIRGESKAKT
jgi:hypothetical protein